MEFKGSSSISAISDFWVLIESDWNLKLSGRLYPAHYGLVLIESDWNLKYVARIKSVASAKVLIESDWNLKLYVYSVNIG